MKRAGWQLVLVGAALAAASRPAAAAGEAYRLEVMVAGSRIPGAGEGKASPPANPERLGPEDGPVIVRAIASGRVGLIAKDFVLKQTDAQPPLALESVKSVPYHESDEPMALVILVQGNFRWMGNETYTDPSDPEAGSIYDGAFKGLGPAIDTLAKAGPAGSKAMLMVYAESKAMVKQPMGDATAVVGSALGTQQDYGEFISKPLVLGLTESWKALANMPGYRKVLVVFGDGQDDKEDASAELKKALADLKDTGVEVYSIFYTGTPEDGPQGQQNMQKVGYTEHYVADSRDNFPARAGQAVDAIDAKYYVDFPGDKLKLDGQEHEFVLAVGGEDKEPVALKLPLPAPRPQGGSLWWVWLLVIVLPVVLLIVVIFIVRRRRVEEPLPLGAPPQLGPVKTIMLGVGGEDSIPVVGWVVPLAGPNQFQTFKLQQGSTKLGTGGESHIVIGDSFMSSEHAEIVCSASGFVINDLGSTNGVYVNARRVSSQELVDNDVFKLGKTDFKFKSIN